MRSFPRKRVDIAVYGGSFNPPHVGHAMVASWLLWTARVEQVLLVPAYAHAFDKSLRSFEERVSFCEALAAAVDSRVAVSRVEEQLAVPSYTIHTLDHLRDRHPGDRFRLVVGADVLQQTHLWRSWERIVTDYEPIVVGRGGYPEVEDAPTFPEISSTQIRERLARGASVAHLVPARVLGLLEGG